MTVAAFIIGVFIGLALMAYASIHERRELDSRHNELMRIAKHEIDDAESRIEELHGELIVKQNIIDSQNERINRQLRIINKIKKTNGRTDVHGDTGTSVPWE